MDGKIALVTGSTSGIGLGIAHLLAKQGCSVILTGLGEEALINKIVQDFKSNYKSKIDFVPVDLRSVSSIHTFCAAVTSIYPEGVDILVNNAGIQHVAPIEEYPDSKWEELMAVNLSAPFHMIKYFLPFMKKKGWGRIINVASMVGVITIPQRTVYGTTKAGVIGLSRGVSMEAAPYGVTCNAICPGFTDAPVVETRVRDFAKEHNLSEEEAKKQLFASLNPTKIPITIDQVR